MDLQLASVWLEREALGFSDIDQFARQCRDASARPTRESAALALLAAQTSSFTERHDALSVSDDVMTRFLSGIRDETRTLRYASAASDAHFDQALTACASRLAPSAMN